MNPYRAIPDVGLLISQGIHAMARGFAALAEVAVAQAKPPRQRLGLDVDDLDERLGYYLRQSVKTRLPIDLSVQNDPFERRVRVSARINDTLFVEFIDEKTLAIARQPVVVLIAAVERLADKINGALR